MSSSGNAPSRRDLAALQGVWKQVAFEENGVIEPPDTHGGNGALTTIRGHHFTVHATTGELLLEGVFTLDASTTPRIMTWIDAMGSDKGKPLQAIYRLEGDHFVFNAADVGHPRPIEFKTGPGQTMRTFVRASSSDR
ncbi:MAG TPA: TIGR03067 domain-containing protein [Rhodanobacteraceae bacterium]|nr:TIGR03067 domain-containing protein [Rhodanobacteraceae bacterium]